jgi:trehalose-phosphatase
VDDPVGARVPATTARVVRALGARPDVHVALVTGRAADSLARVVHVPGAWRAVEHGRVVIAPGARLPVRRLTPDERRRLAAFEHWIREAAVPWGARLERKPESRSLHVRELERRSAARAARLLERAWRMALAAGLHPRAGRGFVEGTLTGADKGAAVASIAKRVRAHGVVYVGDDATDEPAIRAAAALGGIGIFVRSSERPRTPRGARATLEGLADVAALLSALSEPRAAPWARVTPRARVRGAGRSRPPASRRGPSRPSR